LKSDHIDAIRYSYYIVSIVNNGDISVLTQKRWVRDVLLRHLRRASAWWMVYFLCFFVLI